MCGFSGLPKLRQLVRPSGSAPTQARLAEHSTTASTAPRYGSAATRRPLPSMATAIAGRAPDGSLDGESAGGAAGEPGGAAPLAAGEPLAAGAAPTAGAASAAREPPTAGAAARVGSSSTAASAASGRRTVRDPTIESYCSNAHLRDARFAED